MGSNLVSNTLTILAGASLGAIATYLLDPDQGERRRQLIAAKAEQAVSGAGDVVNANLHRAADSARHIAGKLNEYAEKAVDHVSDHVADAADHVSAHAQRVADHATAVRDDLSGRANSLYSRAKRSARQRAGLEPAHPVALATGITLGSVGFVALGAGTMYFLDPAKGRARRAWAMDKAWSWARKSSKSVQRFGRHLGNEMKGYAHDAKAVIPEKWVQSAERVADEVADKVESAAPVLQQ